MKLSRYTLFVEDYPEAGKSLAYNTRTQGMVAINQEIRALLDELPLAIGSVRSEARPILAKLEEMGITMRDDADELDIVRDWFQTIRYNSHKLEAYVLTTYYCNFACPYCFEGKEKEKKYLSKEKADEIILWLKKKAMEVNPEKVEIVFFGGEPLLNIPVLEYVAKEMQDWLKTTPWHWEFTIITNGALVSEALVDRLNPLGLKSIRITIDGDKEFHDQYRPFLSGKGTFDLIIRNIKAVGHKTKIALAGNFNVNNYESIYGLLDFFEREGLKEKIALIDFKPITETKEQKSSNSITASSYSCDPGHSEKMINLKKELIKRGFKTSTALNGGGICHFKAADHQVVIDTDGLIFKCPAMVGNSTKAVGTVSDTENITESERYKDFMAFDLVEWKGKCENCQYLPFCAGGCNYHAELQTGSFKNVFCEKDFYDRTIHDFIKIKYQQILMKKAAAQAQVQVH
jgi:uncharacterized protein